MTRKVLSTAVSLVLSASFALTAGAASSSNLSITVTDFASHYTPGSTTTYTIVVGNSGPDDVVGALVADPVTSIPQVTSVNWTCVAAGGATCSAGPLASAISDTINLPVNGTATYTVLASLNSSAAGDLVNTATVTPPVGVTDDTPGNNQAIDTDHQSALVFVATTGTDSPTCGALTAPCLTIQAGINVAKAGDSVIVHSGTYKECIDVRPVSGAGGVRVESDEHLASSTNLLTIVDGTGLCDGTLGHALGPVARVHDQSSLLGFTIKGGVDSGVQAFGAAAIVANVITGNASATYGGGVRLTTGASLTDAAFKAEIKANSIWSNTAAISGAGIYVDASANGHASLVEIRGNTITGNTAGGLTEGSGGGIAVVTDAASGTDSSRVLIAGNTLATNVAKNAYDLLGNPTGDPTHVRGGGLFVETSPTGAGNETVTIGIQGSPNSLANNVSDGFGGGMAIAMQPAIGATHTVGVDANYLSTNTGKLAGGGLHAVVRAAGSVSASPQVTLRIVDNSFIGNRASGTTVVSDSVSGGGGICAELHSDRTPASSILFELSGNTIQRNEASPYGGGASLLASANDDPNGDGAVADAHAVISFHNNLVAGNAAHDTTAAAVSGGGVHALARARGDHAQAQFVQSFLTVAKNESEVGSGGLEWEEERLSDSLSTTGATSFTLSNSVVSGNDGYGIGGTLVPGTDTEVRISYTDTFGNGSAAYQPTLVGPPAVLTANVTFDPALDAGFLPRICGPTIDAGDPALPATLEEQPNGGRVNLGHLGNTASATRTFPDVNADHTIDGLDVLGVAAAFCGVPPCANYFVAADRDLNGVIDGSDLAYVSAFYGQSCP